MLFRLFLPDAFTADWRSVHQPALLVSPHTSRRLWLRWRCHGDMLPFSSPMPDLSGMVRKQQAQTWSCRKTGYYGMDHLQTEMVKSQVTVHGGHLGRHCFYAKYEYTYDTHTDTLDNLDKAQHLGDQPVGNFVRQDSSLNREFTAYQFSNNFCQYYHQISCWTENLFNIPQKRHQYRIEQNNCRQRIRQIRKPKG